MSDESFTPTDEGMRRHYVDPAPIGASAAAAALRRVAATWERLDYDLTCETAVAMLRDEADSIDGPHCWCGGDVGPREPGDADGLGCLSDIRHEWAADQPRQHRDETPAARRDDREPAAATPPDGWFVFGSHAAWDGQVEFSGVFDPDSGLPLWERPRSIAEQSYVPGPGDPLLTEVDGAVADYRRVWPAPAALPTNLSLAVRLAARITAPVETAPVDDHPTVAEINALGAGSRVMDPDGITWEVRESSGHRALHPLTDKPGYEPVPLPLWAVRPLTIVHTPRRAENARG